MFIHKRSDKEQLSARLERRRSNASGVHADKRTKRLRSRSAKKRHAINEQLN